MEIASSLLGFTALADAAVSLDIILTSISQSDSLMVYRPKPRTISAISDKDKVLDLKLFLCFCNLNWLCMCAIAVCPVGLVLAFDPALPWSPATHCFSVTSTSVTGYMAERGSVYKLKFHWLHPHRSLRVCRKHSCITYTTIQRFELGKIFLCFWKSIFSGHRGCIYLINYLIAHVWMVVYIIWQQFLLLELIYLVHILIINI